MALQRSGLPLLISSAIALIISGAIVWLVANPFRDSPPAVPATVDTPPQPVEEAADDPAVEPAPSAEPSRTDEPAQQPPAPEPEESSDTSPEPEPPEADTEPPQATPPDDEEIIEATVHLVRAGDSLYSLAGEILGDPFLWPLILVENDETIVDPDFLPLRSSLSIPRWTVPTRPLQQGQRDRLSAAHVAAYAHYRSLGSDAVGLGQGQPDWWLSRLGRTRENNARWVLYSGLRYNERLLEEFAQEISAEDLREVQGYRERFGLPPNRR